MRLQRGTIYMAHLDGLVMGCGVDRMWWKPWRWKVTPYPWTRRGANGYIHEAAPVQPITDLTAEGAVAMMKLYGISHKDFEGE